LGKIGGGVERVIPLIFKNNNNNNNNINYADFDIYFFKSKKYDPLPSSPYFLVFTVSLQTSKYNGMNSLGMVELCVRSCISRVTYCIINQ
jgi:hypothetical protein